MPDFFLISGLFLAQVIDRDWRTYLDRKVVHFVYFYLLWTAIQFAFKAPVFVHEHGVLSTVWLYVESFWEPFGTLWFIYLLPIFFVVDQAGAQPARPAARRSGSSAAALEIAHIHTGWTVDRRVREPLRLFLHRLPVRAAHLRAREERGRAPRDRARRARRSGD